MPRAVAQQEALVRDSDEMASYTRPWPARQCSAPWHQTLAEESAPAAGRVCPIAARPPTVDGRRPRWPNSVMPWCRRRTGRRRGLSAIRLRPAKTGRV